MQNNEEEMILPKTYDEAFNFNSRVWFHLRHAHFSNFDARIIVTYANDRVNKAWREQISTGDYSGEIKL